MRDFSEKGKLNADVILSIMQEEKKYFPAGTPAQKIEDTIVKALETYRRRQREVER